MNLIAVLRKIEKLADDFYMKRLSAADKIVMTPEAKVLHEIRETARKAADEAGETPLESPSKNNRIQPLAEIIDEIVNRTFIVGRLMRIIDELEAMPIKRQMRNGAVRLLCRERDEQLDALRKLKGRLPGNRQ